MHSTGPGLRLQMGLCMPYGLWLRVATTINKRKGQEHVNPAISACAQAQSPQ